MVPAGTPPSSELRNPLDSVGFWPIWPLHSGALAWLRGDPPATAAVNCSHPTVPTQVSICSVQMTLGREVFG